MRLENIELRHIKMELVSPFSTSMGTEYFVEHIIIEVDSKDLADGVNALLKLTHITLTKQLNLLGIYLRII